jgi:hypothetical protein
MRATAREAIGWGIGLVILIVAAVFIISSLYILPMHRPALLNDAEWGKPETAAAFNHRFEKGSSERELLGWLAARHFQIDQRADRAVLRVGGFPCAERITVTWTATKGVISESAAVISEGGCL